MKTLECKQVYLSLPPVLGEGDVVSLDLELSGLREEQLHRPAGKFVSLACSFDGETAYLIEDDSDIPQFLENISKATWVFHNATFDIAHTRRWSVLNERPIRDTMLIEKILFSDYYDNFGLNDLVRRYLGCYMEKDVRKEFHAHEGKMTQEQIDYAALDVIGTWLVDREQQKLVEDIDRRVWEKIDMPTVWISVGLSGFPVDVKKWMSISETHKAKKEEIEAELGKKYGHVEKKMSGRGKNKIEVEEFIPFNPASPAQVLKLLNSHGIPVESTGDEVLAPYADKPLVATILDYRNAAKKFSTYGEDYLKFVEPDGKIYSSLNVLGASTGRMSSRSPNMQQIPRGQEYRECFIAGQGKKLIIADYSSQEPRIFAYLTQDPKLIEIINSGQDIYCAVADFAFGEKITKKDKERRNQIKSLVLGLMYGLSPYGFAIQNEVELEVAQEDFDRFFAAFPKAANWVKQKQSVNTKFTTTLLGRKCHLHPYNSQWKRNALNNPIQGSGSDMLKLAMREFKRGCIADFGEDRVGMIMPVHDEIVAWCDESIAEDVRKCLEDTMVSVAEKMHKGIKANVEAHIADSWAEK